jgi:hypothetical protein
MLHETFAFQKRSERPKYVKFTEPYVRKWVSRPPTDTQRVVQFGCNGSDVLLIAFSDGLQSALPWASDYFNRLYPLLMFAARETNRMNFCIVPLIRVKCQKRTTAHTIRYDHFISNEHWRCSNEDTQEVRLRIPASTLVLFTAHHVYLPPGHIEITEIDGDKIYGNYTQIIQRDKYSLFPVLTRSPNKEQHERKMLLSLLDDMCISGWPSVRSALLSYIGDKNVADHIVRQFLIGKLDEISDTFKMHCDNRLSTFFNENANPFHLHGMYSTCLWLPALAKFMVTSQDVPSLVLRPDHDSPGERVALTGLILDIRCANVTRKFKIDFIHRIASTTLADEKGGLSYPPDPKEWEHLIDSFLRKFLYKTDQPRLKLTISLRTYRMFKDRSRRYCHLLPVTYPFMTDSFCLRTGLRIKGTAIRILKHYLQHKIPV